MKWFDNNKMSQHIYNTMPLFLVVMDPDMIFILFFFFYKELTPMLQHFHNIFICSSGWKQSHFIINLF